MAERAPQGAGPVWVWLVGLIAVLGVLWFLLGRGERDGVAVEERGLPAGEAVREEDSGEPGEEDTLVGEVEELAAPVPLSALLPLGPADTGARIAFSGNVVGKAREDGFWLRLDDGVVVFIHMLEQPAPSDEGRVSGTGVLRFDDEGRLAQWLERAELGARERAGVLRDFYIETTTDNLSGR